MVSSSKTSQKSDTFNSDERIIADGDGTAINSGGGDVVFVPDEAFDLAHFALSENGYLASQALDQVADAHNKSLLAVTTAQRSEVSQLGEQIVKVTVPIAAAAFLFWSMKK